jgi:hypothetical protein
MLRAKLSEARPPEVLQPSRLQVPESAREAAQLAA